MCQRMAKLNKITHRMTTAQQIAGIEAVIAELQAIQDKADKFCDGMP